MFLFGFFHFFQVLFYVVAQMVDAILACLILRRLFNGDEPNGMLTLSAANAKDLSVVVWEIIASFILMWVICGVAEVRN